MNRIRMEPSRLDKMLAALSIGGNSAGAYLILEGLNEMNPGYIVGGATVLTTGLFATGMALYKGDTIKRLVGDD